MAWNRYSPDEETFEYYYEKAKQELIDEDLGPWGSGPTKQQIKDRAAQLTLGDSSANYEEYKDAIKEEKFWGSDAWGYTPPESKLIDAARSNRSRYYENEQSDEAKQVKVVEQKVETKLSTNKATLFSSTPKALTTLNISLISKRIQLCANKYETNFGWNNKKKYRAIQDALTRAIDSFEKNPRMSLMDFLTTPYFKKQSIKDAFVMARIWGKSDAFNELCDWLRNDPVELLAMAPPGGLAFV